MFPSATTYKAPGMARSVRSTRVSRHVKAARATVYAALIDANAVAKWKVPTGMTCQMHAFEGREGGTFRISLTYGASTEAGRKTANTDTYRCRFVELVRNGRVVETGWYRTFTSAVGSSPLSSSSQTGAPPGLSNSRIPSPSSTGAMCRSISSISPSSRSCRPIVAEKTSRFLPSAASSPVAPARESARAAGWWTCAGAARAGRRSLGAP